MFKSEHFPCTPEAHRDFIIYKQDVPAFHPGGGSSSADIESFERLRWREFYLLQVFPHAIGIGVADTSLGEGLSPAVEAALPRVADIVADLVDQHRAAE